MQRLLPLLDGNIATAVSKSAYASPASAGASLRPSSISCRSKTDWPSCRRSSRNLRDQVTEQNNSLKRVEDQLEMVREATDRNTLEQQELLEDLKAFGNKVKIVAILALVLVAVGFMMTLALFLHIQRVLP